MDNIKKLTDDWKIKKRKSSCQSFKESIDFKLSSPEEKNSSPLQNGNSLTPIRKTVSKNANVSKRGKTSTNPIKCELSMPLRRSSRLNNKSFENSQMKKGIAFKGNVSGSITESLSDCTSKTTLIDKNCVEIRKESRNEDNVCNLSQWGLPSSVVQAYKSRNIDSMFQWQYECLSMKNVLDGGNLVFSAPTSAGKTLVAEILMLKKVTETKKKAIMILPFVSVVREKVHYFQEMFQSAGVVVDGYMGAHNPPGGFKNVDIAICTIEKANNLVNRLMEEGRLSEVGIIVVDELHMLGDHGRGYLLELLLTKLLYNCKRNGINIQLVGMSATLPNLDVLALWLNSELFRTDFRPVPLHEMVKIGSVVYNAKSKMPSRDLKQTGVSFSDDLDHTVYLSIETITSGHGVLIFCPSKNWCENLATSIAKEIYTVGKPNAVSVDNPAYKTVGEKLREHLNGSQLNDIILQLKSSPAGLDSVLGLTVPFGVAFHHAGLTFDERDIIEGAFRQGILKILVATSTLSSGVNLPARRVIIRSPLFCGAVIDVLSYKQMVGRAGRKGIDEEGESILLCKETERNVALSLVNSELRPVKSCLLKSGTNNLHSSLKRALIEVIASGVASTQEEVLQYVSCTLLFASLAKKESETEPENADVESSIEKGIQYLVDNDIIFRHELAENDTIKVIYKPSRLGLAILASGFSPDDALRVLKELQLARRCFVLENDLHILYEVTPPYLSDQMGALNWMHFLSLWEQLPEEYRRVGELVGVQEGFIGLGIQGRLSKTNHTTIHKMAVHQRFYATLALNDLIQEMPLSVVSEKYDCTRGILQSLQQTTSTFAGMLTTFCNRLGWNNLELLFSSFQRRVHFGIQQELCDLVRLSTLNAQRARVLYNAGFETISSLASASPDELALLLCNMGSFESAKQLDGAFAEEALQRSKAKRIRITGKAGVNEREAANLIIEEAQHFIKQELGISRISWKHLAVKKPDKEAESKASSDTEISNKPATLSKNNEESENVPNLENYPNILRTMYTEESLQKSSKNKSGNLENSRNCVIIDKKKSSAILSSAQLVGHGNEDDNRNSQIRKSESDPCADGSILCNEAIRGSTSAEKYDALKSEILTLSTAQSESMNQTYLLTHDEAKISENINDNILHEKGTVTLMDQTFHTNVERKFSSAVASQKTCSKLNAFSTSLDLSIDEVDHLSFSELLLSKTAETGDIYLTQSFIADPNINFTEGNFSRFSSSSLEDHSIIIDNPIIQAETLNSMHPSHDKPIDAQFSNNDRKSSNSYSFLNGSEFNFMSESRFSLDMQNSLNCDKYCVEKNSTPIYESKHKIEKQLPNCNSLNRNNNLNKISTLNAHSTPIKPLNNDLFIVSKPSTDTSNPKLSHNTYDNHLTKNMLAVTKLDDGACLVESPAHSEKGISVNETSGEIFEAEDSFNVDCVNNYKADKEILPNNKLNSSLGADAIKASKLVAETSGDIFEDDSFDHRKINFDAEAIQHSSKKVYPNQVPKPATYTEENAFFDSGLPDTINCLKTCNSKNVLNCEDKSQIRLFAENIKDKACSKEKIINNDECDKILFLKPEEQSQFWKSWNASQDNIPSNTIPNSEKELENLYGEVKEKDIKGNFIEDLTLNSADNSLFNSFSSECLSPTQPEQVQKREISSDKIPSFFLSKISPQSPKIKDSIMERMSVGYGERGSSQYSSIDTQINLQIIEVLDAELRNFLENITKVKSYAFSVACEKMLTVHKSIGPPKNQRNTVTRKGNKYFVGPDIMVVGLAICYGKASFYIPFHEDKDNHSSLSALEKIKLIQHIFHGSIMCDSVAAYDVKSQFKVLWQGCSIPLKQKSMDPSIAAWLLDPGIGQQSLKMLVNKFWTEAAHLMENFDNTRGSLGLQNWSTTSGKQRAGTEAFVTFHLMNKLLKVLEDQQLFKVFNDLEMPSVLIFAKMEQNGLGFSSDLAVNYQKELQKRQQDILDKAYQMAGRRFNILSSREISRILFKELKLNPILAPDSPVTRRHLGVGTVTRSRRLPPELKTNKECLEKITHLHPLPKTILDWRRLSFSTTKVLMPLLRKHKYDHYFEMNRLYSTCYLYTLTGRVNVHSPNLQFIPRDFNVNNLTDEDAIDDDTCEEAYHYSDEDNLQYGISLRNLFIPSKGNILLTADYSQLELRILAHLSGDQKLLGSLNCNEDVFKSIAAKWKNMSIDSVSNEQRQQAKKICYGMIYGIGANTLSQQLNTTKEDAFVFMETFKNAYPGLNTYFQTVIKNCQGNGYVTTLMQRRRYLPLINSKNKGERAHAERQAINTTIQGSAADLIKAAMIRIEKELQLIYPEAGIPYSSTLSSNLQAKSRNFRGGFLVLQMHDELIYEVSKPDLQVVLGIVKNAMEKTTELLVKLPVNVRTGTSWGSMTEIS